MDANIIIGLLGSFSDGFEFGEAVGKIIYQSPHFNDCAEAYEIYQDMTSLDDFTEYDFLNARRAIRLLNNVDGSDKLYLQFQALYMKALFYALITRYDKSYECLDKIEAMDDGSIFTLYKKSIKEIKESIAQFRKVVQETEGQWMKEKEEEAKAENEKKAREEDMYNRIVRIDDRLQAINDSILTPDGKDGKKDRRIRLLLWMCAAGVVLTTTAIVLLCVMWFG